MTEQAAVLDFDLKSVGEIVKGQRHYQPGEGAHALETCTNCHVPVSFYGNDSTPVLQPGSPSNEAVTCSFCHTLRDVKLTGSMKGMFENASALRQPDAAKSLDQMPYYVSAPETVRRYLWQNAENPALRWVGNLLVRWRPEMHRRDYHVSMLDTSRTCAGCHGAGMDSPLMPVRTYPDWERSPYNTGDLRTSTQCQDCHMTTHPTGKPVREPGRVVWWGPERPQRRSHLFLGGDARVAGELGDTELAALEHELNLRAVTTRVVSASVKSGMLEVDVAVRNVMTGHLFPAFESAVRFGWVQVDALGPDGRRVAGTRTPTTNGARILDTKPGASPIIFRCVDDHLQVLCDTALKPGEERTFHAELPLPEDSRVIGVAAHVFHELDPEPIASATSSISTAG